MLRHHGRGSGALRRRDPARRQGREPAATLQASGPGWELLRRRGELERWPRLGEAGVPDLHHERVQDHRRNHEADGLLKGQSGLPGRQPVERRLRRLHVHVLQLALQWVRRRPRPWGRPFGVLGLRVGHRRSHFSPDGGPERVQQHQRGRTVRPGGRERRPFQHRHILCSHRVHEHGMPQLVRCKLRRPRPQHQLPVSHLRLLAPARQRSVSGLGCALAGRHVRGPDQPELHVQGVLRGGLSVRRELLRAVPGGRFSGGGVEVLHAPDIRRRGFECRGHPVGDPAERGAHGLFEHCDGVFRRAVGRVSELHPRLHAHVRVFLRHRRPLPRARPFLCGGLRVDINRDGRFDPLHVRIRLLHQEHPVCWSFVVRDRLADDDPSGHLCGGAGHRDYVWRGSQRGTCR
mmetsp:Transcript_76127/g.212729  ORF Transcript_76127/g.212729 Transcript_76127/m.212729 type:complete len:404 (-) Transcript_76127:238-1449(-)